MNEKQKRWLRQGATRQSQAGHRPYRTQKGGYVAKQGRLFNTTYKPSRYSTMKPGRHCPFRTQEASRSQNKPKRSVFPNSYGYAKQGQLGIRSKQLWGSHYSETKTYCIAKGAARWGQASRRRDLIQKGEWVEKHDRSFNTSNKKYRCLKVQHGGVRPVIALFPVKTASRPQRAVDS